MKKSDPTAYMSGPGEMAALMRAHDWSATTLGLPETWPQALRTAVRLMLHTRHPMYIFWGDDGACLYNDAYRPSIGAERHPSSLGRPAREVWAEIWTVIGPQIAQVMSGEGATWHEDQLVPITRDGRREDVYWTYSFGPIDDATAPSGIGGVLVVCTETTRAMGIRHQQAFRLGLEAVLRDLADAGAIMAAAAAMLGAQLGAGRCGYGEVDDSDRYVGNDSEWTDGAMPSFAGRWRMDAFGPDLIADLEAGRTVRLDDARTDRRTEHDALAYAQAGDVRAAMVQPLVKNGRFVAALYVHQTAPRQWTDDEAALLRAVAEATWAAVERARAEAALRASEERFRQLAETIEQVFYVTELHERRITYVSPAYERIWGRPREPILADLGQFLATVHPDDRQMVQRQETTQVAGGAVELEYRIVRPDGTIRWISDRSFPVVGNDGTVGRSVGLAVDITQRKHLEEDLQHLNETLEQRVEERTAELLQAQADLRQSQKLEAMGQLTGGVAHDFNNLLTPILGSLDILQRRAPERDRRLITTALQAAERARALVQRLLAFARRQLLEPTAVHLKSLIAGMTELLASTLGPEIELIVSIDPDLPSAQADENQLEMVILNLCANARDAMPDGGRLRLSATAQTVGTHDSNDLVPGRYVRLTVADDGRGMDRATLERAIDPFFSTKGTGKGTGLGLSMAHGFAGQLGGAMSITSELGRGTKVDLWLPVGKPSEQ